MMLIKKSFAIAAMAALLVPAGAFAQSSSDDTYGGPGNVVQGLEQSGGGNGGGNAPAQATSPATSPTKQVQSTQGGLPFTGADLGVLAAAGGMLLGLGFGLRRLTHRPIEA
jgi:hypothetical protein